jgi:hypothetical protein
VGKDHSFDNFIDSLVFDAIGNGITRFDGIVLCLPGVYPSNVLGSLRRLAFANKIPAIILKDAQDLCSLKPKRHVDSLKEAYRDQTSKSLPIPHPLDYEWRFSKNTINYLLERCLIITEPVDIIGLLGVPSIFQRAREINYPRRMCLFDANSAVIECLGNLGPGNIVANCDLTKESMPKLKVKALVCDPPWYEEYMKSFIWSACQICAKEGHILISIPQIGTRPGIEEEWERSIDWAQKCGLFFTGIEPGVLSYLTPPFERNALKADGLYNVPSEWRRANLARFVRKNDYLPPRPQVPFDDKNWGEEIIQEVRIKFRQNNNTTMKFGNPSLETIIPGDILPSVSRLDKRRKLADVWTSGNRIFRCHDTNSLQNILQAISKGRAPEQLLSKRLKRPLTSSETNLTIKTSSQLINIVKQEREEYIICGGKTE